MTSTPPARRTPGSMRTLALAVLCLLVAAAGAAAAPVSPRHNQTLSRRYFHGPVADDQCTVCHRMHAGGLERALKAPVPELCYQCHENVAAKDVVHEPVGKGRCTDCHHVHTADYKPLLLLRVPELCLACHVRDEVHKTRGTLCTGCHGVHSSETSRFLEGGQTRKCLQCHADKVRGDWNHEPAKDGRCLTCHFTHPDPRFATERFRAAYPSGPWPSGGGGSYSLCDRCHPGRLHSDPSFRETGFRSASINLHVRHLRSGKAMTCSACHDMHASRRPKLVIEWVSLPTGAPRPLQYLYFDAGGSCGPACHGAAVYLRDGMSERAKEMD